MTDINLTAERLREVLHYDPDTGALTNRIRRSHAPAGAIAGTVDAQGYRRLLIDGVRAQAHRAVWCYVYGSWPLQQIDHINGIRDDNRLVNLRDVSHSANQQNVRRAQKNNATGFLGVHWHKDSGHYRAQIKFNGQCLTFGCFRTPEEASAAYMAAKAIYHGAALPPGEGR